MQQVEERLQLRSQQKPFKVVQDRMRMRINVFFGKQGKQPASAADALLKQQLLKHLGSDAVTPPERTRQPSSRQFLVDCFGGPKILDARE